jgi:hypothetical protein
MSLKEVCERLSLEGISYGVPRHGKTVVAYAGDDRAEYNPETGVACVTRGTAVAPLTDLDGMLAHLRQQRKQAA